MLSKTWLPLFLTASMTLSVACKKKETEKKQTYEEAIALMCAAPTQAGDVEASMKAQKISTWITEQVKNEEALKLFKSFGSMDAKGKMAAMNAAAKKAKVPACALATMWETSAARTKAGGTQQHGSGMGGGKGGGGSNKSGDKDGQEGKKPATGTSAEHGSGKGGGAGPGGKAKAGNKDGTPGGASAEHGSGKGGGAGPGAKDKAGNKDGTPGGASAEHGSGKGGGAGPGAKDKAGNKDGKQGK